jgi:hypothetical protein
VGDPRHTSILDISACNQSQSCTMLLLCKVSKMKVAAGNRSGRVELRPPVEHAHKAAHIWTHACGYIGL